MNNQTTKEVVAMTQTHKGEMTMEKTVEMVEVEPVEVEFSQPTARELKAMRKHVIARGKQHKELIQEGEKENGKLERVIKRNVSGYSIDLYYTTDKNPSVKSYYKRAWMLGVNNGMKLAKLLNQPKHEKAYTEMVNAAMRGGMVIGIEEVQGDATSIHYHWAPDNAGIQHIQMGSYTENFPLEVVEETANGLVSTTTSVAGHVVPTLYSLSVSDLFYRLQNSPLGRILSNSINKPLMEQIKWGVTFHPERKGRPVNFLELTYGSVSQLRKADADALVIATAEETQPVTNQLTMLNQIGINFDSFKKAKGDELQFGMNKVFTRMRTANSSGFPSTIFNNSGKATKETVEFKQHTSMDGAFETVNATKYTFEDGKKVMTIPVDFTVFQKHLLNLTTVEEGELDFKENYEAEIAAPKTDGIAYMSRAFSSALYEEIESTKGSYSTVQYRMTPFCKGLLLEVPKLTEVLDADLVLFGGAVKADIERYFMDGEVFFSVLAKTKKETENPLGRVSRQAFLNLLQTETSLSAALTENVSIWDKVKKMDIETLRELMQADEKELDLDELKVTLENVGSDDLLRQLVKTNPDASLRSGAVREKIQAYLKATYAKVERGQFMYVKDTSYAYLTVDPMAILNYMSQGWLSAIYNEEMAIGLKPDTVVYPHRKDGKLSPAYGEAGCVRFPMLHKKESRKVMADATPEGFYQTDSGFSKAGLSTIYNRAVKAGFFEGCIVFSLWDMNPEAMSGADFDGDRCLVILSKSFVENMEQQPLFLDYTLVDGELVSGCPFSGEKETKLPEHTFTEREAAFAFKTLKLKVDGFTVSVNKEAYEAHKVGATHILDKVCRFFMVGSLTGNDIGTLTNILATVTEAKQEAKASLRTSERVGDGNLVDIFTKEVEGFDRLEMFLAVAIRWEIDKAKHGGAYREFMPFIDLLIGGMGDTEMSDVAIIERKHGISLQRLFMYRTMKGLQQNAPEPVWEGELSDKDAFWFATKFEQAVHNLNVAVEAFREELEAEPGLYVNRFHVGEGPIGEGNVVKSRTIFAAKGDLGGGYYESEITRIVESLKKSAMDLFGAKYNERDWNLSVHTEAFIQYVRNSNPALNVESLQNEAYALMKNYWDTVYPMQGAANQEVREVLAKLIEKGDGKKFGNHDFDLYSPSRLYNFVVDTASKEASEQAVKLHFAYKNKQAEFEMNARIFAGKDPYQGALAFALAYQALLTENAVIEQRNAMRIARGEVIEADKYDANGNYRYTRMSSCFDLFAQGSIMFFAMLRNGDYELTIETPKVNATVDFHIPVEKVEAVRSYLTNLLAQRGSVSIKKGALGFEWKGLAMAEENQMLTKNTTFANLTDNELALSPYAEEMKALFAESKGFLRTTVFNGLQDEYFGEVVTGRIYQTKDRGAFVRLFLAGVQGAVSEATQREMAILLAGRQQIAAPVEQDTEEMDIFEGTDFFNGAEYFESCEMPDQYMTEQEDEFVMEEDSMELAFLFADEY